MRIHLSTAISFICGLLSVWLVWLIDPDMNVPNTLLILTLGCLVALVVTNALDWIVFWEWPLEGRSEKELDDRLEWTARKIQQLIFVKKVLEWVLPLDSVLARLVEEISKEFETYEELKRRLL